MRKFRGKLKNKYAEEWFYGDLVKAKNEDGTVEYYIISEEYESEDYIIELGTCQSPKVESETIGQSTGLKDKNGVEIYEGDIVKCSFYPEYIFEIKFTDFCWYMRKIATIGYIKLSDVLYYDLEVIGNIHDNKELLEG